MAPPAAAAAAAAAAPPAPAAVVARDRRGRPDQAVLGEAGRLEDQTGQCFMSTLALGRRAMERALTC